MGKARKVMIDIDLFKMIFAFFIRMYPISEYYDFGADIEDQFNEIYERLHGKVDAMIEHDNWLNK